MDGLSTEGRWVGWAAFGLVCLAVLGFVLWRYVGTFVFGVFLYYSVRPLHRRIRPAIPSGTLAAFVSMFVFVLPVLLVAWYALAVVIQDVARFLGSYQVDDVGGVLQPYTDLTRGVFDPETVLDGRLDLRPVLDSFDVFQAWLSFVGLGLVHLFVTLALAFYLLRDERRLSAWFLSYVSDPTARRYVRAVDRDLQTVYFGNIANAALTSVIAVLAYESLNAFAPAGTAIPYPAVVGALTGAASLVPVVGIKLVWIPVAAYVGLADVLAGRPENLWFALVFSAVSLVVVDVIPDVVLRPYVSGRSLHTGALMVTYILGGLLFGWYGIFLAPLLLVVVTEFGRVVLPELVPGVPTPPRKGVDTFAGDDPSSGTASPCVGEPPPPHGDAPDSGSPTDDDPRGT